MTLRRQVCTACGDSHVCIADDVSPNDVAEPTPAVIDAGRLVIDRACREATIDGAPLVLKPREFDLLATLAAARGRVLTRQMIIDIVWPTLYDGDLRTVDVHVRRLRAAIENASPRVRASRIIVSVHSVGYRFVPPSDMALQSVA